MSNIRVDLTTPIKNGMEVVFRSPVDCSQVTGLIIYYNGGSQEFMFADAHGNDVGEIDHLFAEDVVVKVILDVTKGMAFVQNADTNAYLEGRFAETVTHTPQSLTPEQKAQARENIGAADGAELADIRVGHDGEVYTVAGDAVRDAMFHAKEALTVCAPGDLQLYDKSLNQADSYWIIEQLDDTCIVYDYTGWVRTQLFLLEPNRKYKYGGISKTGNTPVTAYFDEAGLSIAGGHFKPQTGGEYILEDIPATAKYISFSLSTVDVDNFVFTQVGTTLREDVENLEAKITDYSQNVVYGNLKTLPSARDGKLLIVPTADGGLAYSDAKFWRWAKDNSLAVSARAYHTIRVSDGAVINSHNCDTVYHIYSITKLLSCCVACMYITDYNATTTVIQEEIGWETSQTLVQAGDIVTFEALLNAALIKSDNNAVSALSRPVGYMIKPDATTNAQATNAFYEKMAELAKSIGMTNTTWESGRISASAGVQSTVVDLCKLLAYIFNNSDKVKGIWNKASYTMSVAGDNARTWTITSTTPEDARELIPEFDGGKTGSSDKKGAYAFCWKDESGVEYATALCEMTLATGDRFQDARHILDECYSIIESK